MAETAPPSAGRRFLSLRISLGAAFVSIVLLTSFLLGTILFVEMRRFLRNDLRAQLRTAAGVAALQIDAKDHEKIKDRSDEMGASYLRLRRQLRDIRARSPRVRFIYTYRRGADGKVVFVVDAEENPQEVSHVGDEYPKPTPAMLAVFDKPYAPHVDQEFATDQWGTFISGFAPLLGPDGTPYAALGMDLSAADAAAFQNRFLVLALAIFGSITLLVSIVSVVLTHRISQPLKDLAADMARIQNFELEGEVRVRSRIDEVVRMKTSLDNMKKGLRSFKRYVPSDLVSELIKLGREAALGAEKRPLTILFSDIEGFTTLSESLPPEKLAPALDAYFEGMTRAILEEGGTVDKFIGDAIMAFWGAPHAVEDHAARACRAALRCQEFIRERFGRGRREGEPAFTTRIGINTGEALVGNFGFRDRLSYTVVGDSVNLASRLEAMNKHYGTRLLVSESTLRAAGDGAFEARPVDRVAVKGKHQGVLVYELAGEKGRVASGDKDYLGRFARAFSLYEGRKWEDAARSFDELLKSNAQDEPARLLRDRSRSYASSPPPSDWDGVFALHEK